MRYKVGDRVRVRTDLIGGNEYPYSNSSSRKLWFAHQMEKFCGREYKITKASIDNEGEFYELSLEVEQNMWVFNDAMLLPANSLGGLICRRENIK
jgi:hypothetical protein